MTNVTIATVCHRKFRQGDPERFIEKHGHKDFEKSAIELVKSIRSNAGKYSDCKIKIWIPWDFRPSDQTLKFLIEQGCKFEYGDFLITDYPNSSKINACNMRFDTDWVLWLDTDVLILQDISGILRFHHAFDIALSPMTRSTNFGAKPESDVMWDQYYKYFNLKRTEDKIQCYDKGFGHFYFTSSVMLFRNDINFGRRYKYFVKKLFESNLPYKDFRFSQTILSLIITEQNLRYKVLDEKYAYVYHFNDYKIKDNTVVTHYCDDMERIFKQLGIN